MKLYNYLISPFAARVRIAIYAKGLDVTLEPPPGFRTEAYRSIVPTGRVPALVVGETTVVESSVICEFIEEYQPAPALLPDDPQARAHIRMLAQITDVGLTTGTLRLVAQLHPTIERDRAVFEQHTATVAQEFDAIERLLENGSSGTAPAGITLADCALFPHVFLLDDAIQELGGPSILDGRPSLAAWWHTVQRHEAVARVKAEMQRALAAYRNKGEVI